MHLQLVSCFAKRLRRTSWLADACEEAGIEFVLAHALYMKAIHGDKNKNDRIDSEKLAHLLRSNLIPPAYVYPAEKRPVRDLLRRRTNFVWRRATLLGQLTCSMYVLGHEPIKKTQHKVRDKWFDQLRAHYEQPLTKMAAEANMYMVKEYDSRSSCLEPICTNTPTDTVSVSLISWETNVIPFLSLAILYIFFCILTDNGRVHLPARKRRSSAIRCYLRNLDI